MALVSVDWKSIIGQYDISNPVIISWWKEQPRSSDSPGAGCQTTNCIYLGAFGSGVWTDHRLLNTYKTLLLLLIHVGVLGNLDLNTTPLLTIEMQGFYLGPFLFCGGGGKGKKWKIGSLAPAGLSANARQARDSAQHAIKYSCLWWQESWTFSGRVSQGNKCCSNWHDSRKLQSLCLKLMSLLCFQNRHFPLHCLHIVLC